MIMGLPEMPRAVADLVFDYNERIRAVFNYSYLRDFLSGDPKASPFCLLTDDRVYAYCDTALPTVKVIDVEQIVDVSSCIRRSKVNKLPYYILFGFLIAITLAMVLFSIFVNKELFPQFQTEEYLLFRVLANLFSCGLPLILAMLTISSLKGRIERSISFSLCIETEKKKIYVPIVKSTGSDEITKFGLAIKTAQAAKKAEIPDAFFL